MIPNLSSFASRRLTFVCTSSDDISVPEVAKNLQLHDDLRYKELSEERRKIETDLKALQRNLNQIDDLLLGEFNLHVLLPL